MDRTTDMDLRPPKLGRIASAVRFSRAQLHWKQQTLASVAKVSLSTVRRVERGEAVKPEKLAKIAIAFGLEPDAYTRPRRVLTEERLLANLEAEFAWMTDRLEVAVAPFTTENQLRALASTDLVVMDSDMPEGVAEDLEGLREWIDLAGFMRLHADAPFMRKPERSFRARELYADIFDHLASVESRHKAVCLVGTYTTLTDNPRMPEMTVGVIALRSKERNPAAAKMRSLWVEKVISWQSLLEIPE